VSILPDPILVALQAIPFALLIFILQKLVFVPFTEYLEERDRATVGARKEALQLQQDAESRLKDYEAKLESARAEAQQIRSDRRKIALDERENGIAAARGEADQKINDALDTIAGERELAGEELRRLSRTLGTQIAEQVLGRAAPSN